MGTNLKKTRSLLLFSEQPNTLHPSKLWHLIVYEKGRLLCDPFTRIPARAGSDQDSMGSHRSDLALAQVEISSLAR